MTDQAGPTESLPVNPKPARFVLFGSRSIMDRGILSQKTVSFLVKEIHADQTIGEVDDMAVAGIRSTPPLHDQFIANPGADKPLGDRDRVKLVDRMKGRVAPHLEIRQELSRTLA